MARRGLNIYKRKDGRWEGRYKCGYTTEGKVKYRSVYGKSYSAVKEILEREKSKKKTAFPCKCTIGELLEHWLSDVKNRVKESTYANYVMKLQKHILPHFAGIKYEVLTAQMLNDYIRIKLDSGLSEKYVSDIVVLLKSAAKYGSKVYGYANYIENITLPKARNIIEKPLLTPLEQQRLRKELIHNKSSCNAGILLASVTGIRIGELCALKWSDIDLEKSILTVRHTVQRVCNVGERGTRLIITSPKSRSSIRQIPLPNFIAAYLKGFKSSDNCYVLSGSEKIVEPRTLQYRFKSLLKKLALSDVPFHSMRHSFASDCIAAGVDVKTLSEILGHHSVEVTLNRYVHSSIERKRECMKIFSESVIAV